MESSIQNSAWTDFKLNKQLLDAIAENNFAAPTDIQKKSIPLVLGGQQVIGIAQTGTGKTAAYMLPLFMKVKFAQGEEARALILVPTKELVLQVAEQAKKLAKYTDLRIMPIYGGVGIKAQIEVIKKGVDIIIATPGRFIELYQQRELSVKSIKTLVIDEADRMMDMGFRQQLHRIFEIIPQKRQNLLFSATFPDKVDKLSQDFLEFPVRIEITPQATAAKQVAQELYHVPNMKTKINFLEYLFSKEEFSRVMIFARTKDTANNIYKFLERKITKSVRVIHSNKSQNTRINAMNDFKEGNIRVLVATDVAARGIDVEKVSHVINFDVPDHYEDYVHRIGRTGRAFQEGTAITFVTKAELYHIENIEKLIREKIKVKELPKNVKVEETSFEETQAINREIDRQNRLDNPDFLGAFHEKKIKR